MTTRQEYLTVTGARENNLRDVSTSVPKRQITGFVGAVAARTNGTLVP